MSSRQCSRPACKQVALFTLTYVYRDSTRGARPAGRVHRAALLRPVRRARRPADRAARLGSGPAAGRAREQEADDLEALANAVREAALPQAAAEPVGQGVEVGRRGHLRVLRSSPPDRGR